MSPADYKRQLDIHDWNYHYSDDPRVYAKGEHNQARLKALADSNPELKKIYDEHGKGVKR